MSRCSGIVFGFGFFGGFGFFFLLFSRFVWCGKGWVFVNSELLLESFGILKSSFMIDAV